MNNENELYILNAVKSRDSYEKIAKKTGLSISWIWEYIKKNNILYLDFDMSEILTEISDKHREQNIEYKNIFQKLKENEKRIQNFEKEFEIISKNEIPNDKKYPISKNDIVIRLYEAQKDCLTELKSHIETPFKDMWEYKDWEGWARALQLAQTTDNKLSIENKAFWRYLIKEEYGREVVYRDSKGNIRTPDARKREWVIEIFYNYLTKTFSMAREQLRKEDKDEEVK